MALAVMQPYFFPYPSYFQLIAAVDRFVVYDRIEYTKRGWINRNRFLRDGQPVYFTIPLKGASDHAAVVDRVLAEDFRPEKLIARVRAAYRGAPHLKVALELFESALYCGESNLFTFIHKSIQSLCNFLGLKTEIVVSSEVSVAPDLRGQDRVLALCGALDATTYVNATGGRELYTPAAFSERGIDLRFIESDPFVYPQLGHAFVPNLSILDAIMFNPAETLWRHITTGYRLVEGGAA